MSKLTFVLAFAACFTSPICSFAGYPSADEVNNPGSIFDWAIIFVIAAVFYLPALLCITIRFHNWRQRERAYFVKCARLAWQCSILAVLGAFLWIPVSLVALWLFVVLPVWLLQKFLGCSIPGNLTTILSAMFLSLGFLVPLFFAIRDCTFDSDEKGEAANESNNVDA